MLNAARVQLAGDIDDLVTGHRQLVGPRWDDLAIPGVAVVIRASHTDRQSTLLVRIDGDVDESVWAVHDVTLEDVILGYLANGGVTANHAAWGVPA